MRALREACTMGGWADELPATGLLARRFLDVPVVLFRGADGHPVALADRCPHRFLPLSRGMHTNGTVRCAYHGLPSTAAGASCTTRITMAPSRRAPRCGGGGQVLCSEEPATWVSMAAVRLGALRVTGFGKGRQSAVEC
jgi:Rieske [2Fe-2S] domain